MKPKRKKEKNIFTETDKRNGSAHTVVSKSWPDGERFRRRCPNLATARNLLARINGAIVTGQWEALRDELTLKKTNEPEIQSATAVLTFGSLVREFKTFIKGQKSLSDWPTIQGYIANGMVEFFGSDTPVTDITLQRCEEYIADRRGDEIRACTVNKELSVLRAMFSKAKERKYIATNPVAELKSLKDDSLIHDRYLKPEELDALLRAALMQLQGDSSSLKFHNMPELIVFAVNTGLRLSECLSLPIAHINFEQQILSVKNKPTKRTKNGTERHIRFNHDTRDVLAKLLKNAVNESGTIFQKHDGSSWLPHKRILHEQFRQCVKAAGLYSDDRTQNVTIHSLRHTFGSQLALRGRPVGNIKYLMGHRWLETTQRYMHIKPEETFRDTDALQGLATNWQRAKDADGANGL